MDERNVAVPCRKLNALAQPGRPRKSETRVFEADGQPWELTCRAPNTSDLAFASDEADALVSQFIEGPECVTFPDQAVRPSRTHFITCATVAACQESLDPSTRYSAFELAILSVKRPADWAAITSWVDGLCLGFDKSQGE